MIEMTDITVSRAFCGRRVITVGKDDRTFFARESGRGWDVYAEGQLIKHVTKVRLIDRVVYGYIKAYE